MVWIILAIVVSGCGVKDAQQVVNDLSKRSEELESYISHGMMTIQTGQEPLEYEVEVWYKQPHFYRVELKNIKKDITQILLKNETGVYVLTPHLKKSFRFQSDWPETSGQVYLYQTIMNSIVDDQSRKFQAGEKDYQFEVAAKYSINQSLQRQKIWLDQELYPKKVDVLNANNEVMIQMNFDQFKAGASFDKDAFDMQRNLSSLPQFQKKPEEKQTISAVTPRYLPQGSQLMGEQTIDSPDGPVVIMRFKGKQPFTLTQKSPQVIAASLPLLGKPVELEESIGVLMEVDQRKKLSWTYNGTDFELLGNLPLEEMVLIANSVFNQPIK
ncbi:LolA family protein [Hazenella coriacea]|nr:outer membrane lipoprotein carrier protein LolA [Hazenella coriacea]